MKTGDRRPHFLWSLAGVVQGGVLLALWGAATQGSLLSWSNGPTIESLASESGSVGTLVNIKGAHFGVSQGDSTVTFNGVSAELVGWSDTKIKAVVPVGATTGTVVVTVNGRASSGVDFTVTATPASD